MQAFLNEDRIKNPVGGESTEPRERKRKSAYVLLLGRSDQGRAEAGDTLTMISHAVEISIARGRVDEKDGREQGAKPPL